MYNLLGQARNGCNEMIQNGYVETKRSQKTGLWFSLFSHCLSLPSLPEDWHGILDRITVFQAYVSSDSAS